MPMARSIRARPWPPGSGAQPHTLWSPETGLRVTREQQKGHFAMLKWPLLSRKLPYGRASKAFVGTVTEPIRPELVSTTTTRSEPGAGLKSMRSSNVRPSFTAR